MSEYIAPAYQLQGFHCPHCGVLSQHTWETHRISKTMVAEAICTHCRKISLWVDERLAYPPSPTAPIPHRDMPADVRALYEEARAVFASSARSAAALLRIGIELLVRSLNAGGDTLFDRIGQLRKRGMPEGIIRAMDVVRVVGNNAVHPGQIDLNDTPEIANKLFRLMNVIIENQISIPGEIETLYRVVLTEGEREAIDRRDQGEMPPET